MIWFHTIIKNHNKQTNKQRRVGVPEKGTCISHLQFVATRMSWSIEGSSQETSGSKIWQSVFSMDPMYSLHIYHHLSMVMLIHLIHFSFFPGSPYCICDAQVLEIKILSTSNFLAELWVRVCRLAHILDIDTNTEKPMVQSHQVRHTSKAEDAQFHMKCFIDGFKHASHIYIFYYIILYNDIDTYD